MSRSTRADAAAVREVLVRAVRASCPRSLADQAEDLVQSALVRLLQGPLREGEGAVPASYLWKVATSAVIDELRRRRRRPEESVEQETSERNPAREPSPERRAEGGTIRHAITACLATLVRPRRLAVILHLQGHGVPETAGLLGWDAKRAENLVYRGLADLRSCLRGKGIEP